MKIFWNYIYIVAKELGFLFDAAFSFFVSFSFIKESSLAGMAEHVREQLNCRPKQLGLSNCLSGILTDLYVSLLKNLVNVI